MKPKKQLNLAVLKIPEDQEGDKIKISSLCQLYWLEQIGGIKRIDLSHNNITDLECWKYLNGFDEIDLSFNQISDIFPLIKLKNMKILFINGNRINFNQIYQFKEKRPDVKFNLNHVVVGDKNFYYDPKINRFPLDEDIPGIDVGKIERIDDIKGLGNYDNLYGLRMRGIGLETLRRSVSLEGLEKLTNLKALIIDESCFSDITPLGKLKNLEILVLREPFKQIDLNPLNALQNLRYLRLGEGIELGGTFIKKIEDLENMTALKYLSMPHCCVEKIEGLENLKNLESLDLSNNYIEKIEGLENLENLRILLIIANQITKIENLNHLHNLRELDLKYNGISKIEGIDKLRNLKSLDLEGNKILKIEGIENLQNLENLNLRNNMIAKIEGIDKLRNLKNLFLDKNKISKIEGLDNLQNLKNLSLSSNRIFKIEELDNLQNLKTLHLSNNKISKLEGLKSLAGLESLWLSNNNFPNLSIFNTFSKCSIVHKKDELLQFLHPSIDLKELKISF